MQRLTTSLPERTDTCTHIHNRHTHTHSHTHSHTQTCFKSVVWNVQTKTPGCRCPGSRDVFLAVPVPLPGPTRPHRSVTGCGCPGPDAVSHVDRGLHDVQRRGVPGEGGRDAERP